MTKITDLTNQGLEGVCFGGKEMAVEKWKQFNVKSCCVSSMHQVNCDKNYFSRRILNRKASYQGLVRQYCTKKIVNQRKKRSSIIQSLNILEMIHKLSRKQKH